MIISYRVSDPSNPSPFQTAKSVSTSIHRSDWPVPGMNAGIGRAARAARQVVETESLLTLCNSPQTDANPSVVTAAVHDCACRCCLCASGLFSLQYVYDGHLKHSLAISAPAGCIVRIPTQTAFLCAHPISHAALNVMYLQLQFSRLQRCLSGRN
jgi:hypothetical protein